MHIKDSLLKWWKLPTLFLLSYLVTATAITGFARWVVPIPHLGGISARLTAFLEEKDEFDILFLGSSYYKDAINSEHIDQEMNKLGCRVRSFKFGADGLNAIEYMFVLEQIKQSNPLKLSTIIIDLPSPHYRSHLYASTRTRFFNSWSNFFPFVYEIWSLPRFRKTRSILLYDFFLAFIYERTGINSLSRLLAPLLPPPNQQKNHLQQTKKVSSLEKASTELKKKQLLIKQAENLVVETDVWKDGYAKRNQKGHFARLQPILKKLQGIGLKFAVVLAPGFPHYAYSEPLREIFSEKVPETPLWHYNFPNRWPELFNGENLSTISHMNSKGAKIFSTLLAKDLCKKSPQKQ
ncbi:MAG: hypothetical protein HQL70_05860 [Magnetococcales bacterium]|nr:hypothetical protein [Magnetococcales bacterium]